MNRSWIAIATFVLLSPAMAASELPYTFVEGSWSSVDPDEGDSGTGPMLDVSYGLTGLVHLVGSYQNVDFDTADATFWEVGAGVHRTMREDFDLFAEATYVDAEVEFSGGDVGDEGFSLCAGVRKPITHLLEVNGGVEYIDIGDDEDTLLGVNALYTLKERYAVGGGIQIGDANTLRVGFRVTFGQR